MQSVTIVCNRKERHVPHIHPVFRFKGMVVYETQEVFVRRCRVVLQNGIPDIVMICS